MERGACARRFPGLGLLPSSGGCSWVGNRLPYHALGRGSDLPAAGSGGECRPTPTQFSVSANFFVLQADFVDQIGVDHDALPQGDGPWLGVGPGIIHGDPYFEVSEVRPPDFFPHLGVFGHHTSVPIDPRVVAQSNRVDHQGVPGPIGRRISLPRRVRVDRQRARVGEHLTVSTVHFVQHHQKAGFVHELQQMRQAVRANKIVRQTPDVGVVDRLVGGTLLDDRDKPRLIRQAVRKVHPDIPHLTR